MNETLVKYLAGLLDADGNLSFVFAKNKQDLYTLHLRITLCASVSIDKEGKFLKSLPDLTEMGTVNKKEASLKKHSDQYVWRVNKSSDINKILPRLIKHMVVKAKPWDWMFEVYKENKGRSLSQYEVDALKKESIEKRKQSGPIKPKNHPTWAWVAGFLDGDGCYSNRFYKKTNRRHMRIDVEIAHYDSCANELLYKAFGGKLRKKTGRGIEKSHWHVNLGPQNKSFALSFLSRMAQHSRLKKHKIESLIHIHRQRLSESSPTG